MATVGQVEAAIERVEGFRALFYSDGKKVRADRDPGMAPYPYSRAARGSWTVQEWVNNRWARHYSGWTPRIRTTTDMPVLHWNTTLDTVRSRGRG